MNYDFDYVKFSAKFKETWLRKGRCEGEIAVSLVLLIHQMRDQGKLMRIEDYESEMSYVKAFEESARIVVDYANQFKDFTRAILILKILVPGYIDLREIKKHNGGKVPVSGIIEYLKPIIDECGEIERYTFAATDIDDDDEE